ncbi:GerMN domain-containing protein [Bacillus sp. RG28]|uniref:GerMN domain-containing protein n=1 Tax=Gottfriedia endophytica TaxID=2820819 RepID=A0A940NN94_9BACI|nr:GerMN domain-containing protein [Gottfriedia endophytica]MBP0723922.1 GerMN domain-containing protein [Gottfriedia endophytica]
MKKQLLVGSVFVCAISLAGCNVVPSTSMKEIDPPKTVSYVSDQPSKETDAKQNQTIDRELYLIDSNGYVVPRTLHLSKEEGMAKQALAYLIKDGPVTDQLPNGFQAVLPANTEVLGLNTQKDGTCVVNFSSEFKQYRPQDELKIFQSLTWTLTQFENIKRVKIQVEGKAVNQMPVNKTEIDQGLSREDGINFDRGSVVDIMNSKTVTVYFLSQNNAGDTYYVPVTRRISNDEVDSYTAIIKELVKGPSDYSNLVSDFDPDTKLVSKPEYQHGKLILNFNEGIFGNIAKNMINDNVLNPLVLSLTEQPGVNSLEIQVNGKKEALNQQRKLISSPVTRPKDVNTKDM